MQVKYLAHASFLITAENGTRIVTDPYQSGDQMSYGKIQETAEVVTVSHEHFDHNNAAAVKGNPTVVKKAGATEARGIKFQGISCYHDEAKGSKRGNNVIFCFEVDGMRVCHFGDLGHALSDAQIKELGKVDILLTPVGGFYTIDAAVATEIAEKLKPKVLIPMHFKTAGTSLPIAEVDQFLKGKKNVKRLDSSTANLRSTELPAPTQIVVLKPSL